MKNVLYVSLFLLVAVSCSATDGQLDIYNNRGDAGGDRDASQHTTADAGRDLTEQTADVHANPDIANVEDTAEGEPDMITATGNAFGYPVGDQTTSPAGGWQVWQVMGAYWATYGGRHLAQDVAGPTPADTVNAPVYSPADGTVLYAGGNGSSYRNVVLLEHPLADGGRVCSFYGHVNPPVVSEGDSVVRGQMVTTVMGWNTVFPGQGDGNTHLHYVFLSDEICEWVDALAGGGVCGYDNGDANDGLNSRTDLENEPATYTPIADDCAANQFLDGFISPTQFIDANHF